MQAQPALFIPHGGGPCFFMDDPHGIWTGMAGYLRALPDHLPRRPDAIILVSAHWETEGFSFTSSAKPNLLYDYYGFPPHTYELAYDAPGAPKLAAEAASFLIEAGLPAQLNAERGYDHGVFVPLKLAFPDADIPIVEMSLDLSLDPALHIAAGRALAPLRSKNILIIGSGMSFHNMRAYGDPRATETSRAFDAWLTEIAQLPAETRDQCLIDWAQAPGARFSHPREEHLIPLMVAAGASATPGEQKFGALVLQTAISGFAFA